jgi:predicted aspartyl protease
MLTLKGEFPPRRTVRLMVDTGAELSFVARSVAVDLGLRQLRTAEIVGVSQRPEVHPVYAATLFLGINTPTPDIVQIPIEVAAMRENITGVPFNGLLGRVFLRDFELAYSGRDHTFALSSYRASW